MKILADRIQNLTDARYFAAKEVDFLSFSIEENAAGYLDPMHVKAIKEWVEGPVCLAEFNRFSAEAIAETLDFLELEGAIVGHLYSKMDLEKLAGRRLFRVIEFENSHLESDLFGQMTDEKPLVEAFIFDFSKRLDPTFSLDFLQNAAQIAPIFLKMPFETSDFLDFLEKVNPAGIVFSGGDEERVGVKSFDEIDALFELLEV